MWGSYQAYLTTVHQAAGGNKQQNSNNVPTVPQGTNYGDWHTYGCLWTPMKCVGILTTIWWRQSSRPRHALYSLGAGAHVPPYLYAGSKWPMYVDYVHVWQ